MTMEVYKTMFEVIMWCDENAMLIAFCIASMILCPLLLKYEELKTEKARLEKEVVKLQKDLLYEREFIEEALM